MRVEKDPLRSAGTALVSRLSHAALASSHALRNKELGTTK